MSELSHRRRDFEYHPDIDTAVWRGTATITIAAVAREPANPPDHWKELEVPADVDQDLLRERFKKLHR
jgi:hypothetical protein